LATASEPITPPAPGRFSTTKFSFRLSLSLLRHDAPERVGAAAGRERRDDLHRLGRPGLSHCAVCTCTKQKQNKKARHEAIL
jgi:hypothetical protein